MNEPLNEPKILWLRRAWALHAALAAAVAGLASFAGCSSDDASNASGGADASIANDDADVGGGNGDGATKTDAGVDACALPEAGLGVACTPDGGCTCGTICVLKKCAPASACDEAVLSWDGPTSNTDGTCVTDLAGFNIRWWMDGGAINFYEAGLPCVPGPTVSCGDAGQSVAQLQCAHRVRPLANGEWAFTVTAVSEAGVESTPAGPVNKTIACP